eukprot:2744505-Prorocentrum_lima.AAC.1
MDWALDHGKEDGAENDVCGWDGKVSLAKGETMDQGGRHSMAWAAVREDIETGAERFEKKGTAHESLRP